MSHSKLPTRARRLVAVSLQFFVCLALTATAAIPSAEKLLPDDTLVLVTAPDYTKMREIYRNSAQSQLWNDPAMKPFKDNFVSKLNEQLIQPLEHDLGVHFSDYTNLPQGQITLAVTQNGWPATQEGPGLLFLLDTKDKSTQLTKNLADLRKKWVEAGKTLRTEKIRNIEFAVLPISEKDIPKTLRKFSGADHSADSDETATNAPKNEIYIGQFESLLILGTSAKPIEKVLVHLTGGEMPALGDLAAYDTDRLALFRDAPIYGWANAKSFIDLFTRKQVKEDPDTPDPFSMFSPAKILAATGFNSLKTLAFSLHLANDGSMAQFFASMPESSRQGLFTVFPGNSKDASPPPFVPADVVKFQRWRIDGQKAWTALQKVLSDISPQARDGINFMIDTANKAAQEKDPSFDMNKNFFGNLGDDMMSYQKAPRGTTAADLNSPPSLFLMASPNPDQLVGAFKYLLLLANQQGATPKEREFLGRKIYSVELAGMTASLAGTPGKTRELSYVASGGYVAISTDASILEEYLRSADNPPKALRDTPGLTDAIARVGGSSAGLFGYENQVETTRTMFEGLRNSATTNAGSFAMMPGLAGLPNTGTFKGLMDFSLLPPFDKISKYFGFSVYTTTANMDGLTFKMYAPVPAGLRK
jgi:hypothetical protein